MSAPEGAHHPESLRFSEPPRAAIAHDDMPLVPASVFPREAEPAHDDEGLAAILKEAGRRPLVPDSKRDIHHLGTDPFGRGVVVA